MTIAELRARLAELITEMRSIDEAAGIDDLGEDVQVRFDQFDVEATEIRTKIEKYEERQRKIADAGNVPGATEGGSDRTVRFNTREDAYDLSDLRYDVSANDLRARARKAIEQDDWMDDDTKQRAERTLTKVDKRGELASLYLHTGGSAYRSAFMKLIAGQGYALDEQERQAVARAQSTTTTAGGFAVPFTLDPTVLLTNDGVNNPMREIANVKQTTTEDWNGVTSAGASASWDGEAVQVSDDSVTLAQPSIDVHKLQIFIPFSVEIEGDWANMENELRMVIAEARDVAEGTAHINGTGTGQPIGLITALDGGSSEVTPATAETFAQADVFNLRRQLPPRYRRTRDQAKWLAAVGTYDDVRQFDTGGGGGFWTDMNDGTPDRLIGYRTYEASEMDDSQDINAAATADNHVLVVGDFSRYVIVDRVGMRIELVPHLFGTANNRPTGQRGLLGWLRTGADSIDDNAFRVLNVATTA